MVPPRCLERRKPLRQLFFFSVFQAGRGGWLLLKERISDPFHIEQNTLVVRVFLLIINQTEFHLTRSQKENCHHDRIPFELTGIGNRFLRVQRVGSNSDWNFRYWPLFFSLFSLASRCNGCRIEGPTWTPRHAATVMCTGV